MDNQSLIKRNIKYIGKIFTLAAGMFLICTCERRPLEDDDLTREAFLEVNIDWSNSGLTPSSSTYSGDDVHRVSLRFFPKDKDTELVERYLEGNVTSGTIHVPIGNYAVVVYNESIDDEAYWGDAVTFTDINLYSSFAANAATFDNAQRQQQFPYYKPADNEKFVVEPMRIASWSLDNFKVTEGMALVSQGQQPNTYLTIEERDMLNAFKNIVMRALTHNVNLTAKIENLASVGAGFTAMKGVASKVYLASGLTAPTPATYLFMLTRPQFESGSKNGTTNNTFLSFGRIPASSSEAYFIAEDIVFVNGEMYKPATPLLFDVTPQMKSNANAGININLNIEFQLPLVEGNIGVDDWGTDDVFTLE